MQTSPFRADGGHRNISAWAIRNPAATGVLFLLLALAGLVALPGLRVNNAPDLDLPTVTVTVALPGAAPSELEALVTRRVEDAVSAIGDVKRTTSAVVDGTSTTVVEFVLGKDIDRAAADIREQMARIRPDLPQSARDPVVARVEATGGVVLTYAVSAPRMGEEQVSWFVDGAVAKALLSLPGVAQVDRIGGVDREIRVALRPDRLLALGITANQVNAQLRELNLNLPGGRVAADGGERAVRTLGSAASVEDLRERSISLPGGRTARLGDIARVADATGEVRTAALLDGRPVVAFEVVRTRGSSEVRVADRVAAAVAKLEGEHPGTEIRLIASTVGFVRAGYRAAVEALAAGALLAVLAVWAFLRDWRATLVASLAIPLSLLPTFLVMEWLDYSLNNVTLLGLGLVVGVLVDDAIVEVENIVRHLRANPDAGAR